MARPLAMNAALSSAQTSRTRWTVIRAVQTGTDEERLEALETLLRKHAPALSQFLVIRFKIAPDIAEDWTQDFILDRVLQKGLIEKAARENGRFRNFLLRAVSNFALSKIRHEKTEKRRSLLEAESLDRLQAEQGFEVPDSETERIFNESFTRQAVCMAVDKTREYCLKAGRQDIWAVFEGRILMPAFQNEPAIDYSVLCHQHGIKSAGDAHNILISAKRIFRRELRRTVADYSDSEQGVEDELRALRKFFDSGQE